MNRVLLGAHHQVSGQLMAPPFRCIVRLATLRRCDLECARHFLQKCYLPDTMVFMPISVLQRGADTWTSYSVIRMKVVGQEIEQIVDYIHCPWMIPAATAISLVRRREMSD